MAAGKAHRPGEAGLPGEHILGAARVALAAQPERDGVAVPAEIAHERGQRQRAEIVEPAVDERDVAHLAQASREAFERRAPYPRTQLPQRLEVVVELDELLRLLGR